MTITCQNCSCENQEHSGGCLECGAPLPNKDLDQEDAGKIDAEGDFESMLRRLVRATRDISDPKVEKVRTLAEDLLRRKGHSTPFR